jgi:hypothetical protein
MRATKRARRVEVQDDHGRTWVDPIGESRGVGRDFYVTVVDGSRTGWLLGPYATHGEALKKVELGRKLAEKVNDRAIWYAYGTASVDHGIAMKTVFGEDGCSSCVREFPRFMARVRHCPFCGSEV